MTGRAKHAGTSVGRARRVARIALRVGVVAAVAVTVPLSFSRGRTAHPVCTAASGPIHVTASPDIAPVVEAVAATLSSASRSTCVTVRVTRQDPADVMDQIKAGAAQLPDVWIPDSSTWLLEARAAGLQLPGQHPSVATSPLVLAVPEASGVAPSGTHSPSVAASASAPTGESSPAHGDGRLRPADIAGLLASGVNPRVHLVLPEPQRSTAGLAAVLGLQDALAGRPQARAELTAALRLAQPAATTNASALLDWAAERSDVAVPASEQAVWHHRLAGRDRTAAVYPPGQAHAFDYPFVLLNARDSVTGEADVLLKALQSSAGRQRLQSAGFRDSHGHAGPALAGVARFGPIGPSADRPPTVASVQLAIRTLQSIRKQARVLAVMDVSGSMDLLVPGAHGATRLQLAQAAAARGLALYPDSTDIGLWVFSTNLTPSTDYRQVVPMTRMTAGANGGRHRLSRALASIQDVRYGDTGLYDTTLAAVRAVRRSFDPSRINAVVLLSDGKNDDAKGISLRRLLGTLRKEQDQAHPVPVITIAYGPDSDATSMAAISAATAGSSYRAKDPRQISRIFLDAVGQRVCRPSCSPS
ncbi:substrate-binding and VWA domain-containing protein [Pedococcus sp. 5OH_020]|uniref:substrate-binding and VWA domain-containing protein n=1 Tax=Pedococcus sp. 5OH_020 TaxID=2989814 RepID=UPI0022E9FE65|nr:substrate-binding and VWA domain-containing protein [Pedococcus sp. 5OH_020]